MKLITLRILSRKRSPSQKSKSPSKDRSAVLVAVLVEVAGGLCRVHGAALPAEHRRVVAHLHKKQPSKLLDQKDSTLKMARAAAASKERQTRAQP